MRTWVMCCVEVMAKNSGRDLLCTNILGLLWNYPGIYLVVKYSICVLSIRPEEKRYAQSLNWCLIVCWLKRQPKKKTMCIQRDIIWALLDAHTGNILKHWHSTLICPANCALMALSLSLLYLSPFSLSNFHMHYKLFSTRSFKSPPVSVAGPSAQP